MPIIDSLARVAESQRADALILETGRAPALVRGGEALPLAMPPLAAGMLATMLDELLDPDERGGMGGIAIVEARRAVLGFAVRVETTAGGTIVTLRRSDASKGRVAATAPGRPATGGARAGEGTIADDGDRPAPSTRRALAIAPALPDGGGRRIALDGADPLAALVALADARRASDVFLSGRAVLFRIDGELAVADAAASPALVAALVDRLDPRGARTLAESGSVDLGLDWHDGDRARRLRANLFRHTDGLAATLRLVDERALPLEQLGLPAELAGLALQPSGLVLVTGLAGSGKSTTLAALVDALDQVAARHVITLEDPIERRYRPRRCLVHQREVGHDVDTFASGLRAALRESPDVLLVGEMRDPETIAAALTAADTGHLVLSTVHAATAATAIDRIVHAFPADRLAAVRGQLASVLRAVLAQRLVAGRGGGRHPIFELLQVTGAVAALIRDDRGHQLATAIQTGRADGMVTFEASLADGVRRGDIAAPTRR